MKPLISKCSMIPAWHQLVPISEHVEESETARKLQLYATSIKTYVSTRLRGEFPNFSSFFYYFLPFFLIFSSFSSSIWCTGWAARPPGKVLATPLILAPQRNCRVVWTDLNNVLRQDTNFSFERKEKIWFYQKLANSVMQWDTHPVFYSYWAVH